MVAARVDPAAARPRRDAAHLEAVRARLDADAERAEAVGDGLDPVGLLCAQLRGAADDGRRRARARRQRDERQLVDEPRHLLGLDRRRDERRRADLEVGGRLAADACAG